MDEKTLLFGGKSQALIAREMLNEQGRQVAFIFDSTLERPGFPFDGAFGRDQATLAKFLTAATEFLVCIGSEHGLARVKISQLLAGRYGLRSLDLRSLHAIVDPSVTCGEGVQVMPGALLHMHTHIGDYTLLNSSCTVGHECVLGQGVHIMPEAAVAERVTIADFATIGTNATIIADLKIGEGAFVGASAVVLEDVPPYAVVVGNPARKLRPHALVCEMAVFDGI